MERRHSGESLADSSPESPQRPQRPQRFERTLRCSTDMGSSSVRSSPTVSPRRKWTSASQIAPGQKMKLGSPAQHSVLVPTGSLRGAADLGLNLGSPFSTQGRDKKLSRKSSLSPTVAGSVAALSTRRRFRLKFQTFVLCIAFAAFCSAIMFMVMQMMPGIDSVEGKQKPIVLMPNALHFKGKKGLSAKDSFAAGSRGGTGAMQGAGAGILKLEEVERRQAEEEQRRVEEQRRRQQAAEEEERRKQKLQKQQLEKLLSSVPDHKLAQQALPSTRSTSIAASSKVNLKGRSKEAGSIGRSAGLLQGKKEATALQVKGQNRQVGETTRRAEMQELSADEFQGAAAASAAVKAMAKQAALDAKRSKGKGREKGRDGEEQVERRGKGKGRDAGGGEKNGGGERGRGSRSEKAEPGKKEQGRREEGVVSKGERRGKGEALRELGGAGSKAKGAGLDGNVVHHKRVREREGSLAQQTAEGRGREEGQRSRRGEVENGRVVRERGGGGAQVSRKQDRAEEARANGRGSRGGHDGRQREREVDARRKGAVETEDAGRRKKAMRVHEEKEVSGVRNRRERGREEEGMQQVRRKRAEVEMQGKARGHAKRQELGEHRAVTETKGEREGGGKRKRQVEEVQAGKSGGTSRSVNKKGRLESVDHFQEGGKERKARRKRDVAR